MGEMQVPEGFGRDVIRIVDKALDVLRKVNWMMQAEAQMNAAKHMADVVRPNPLAAAVSTAIADLEMSKRRLVPVREDDDGGER